MLQFHLVTSSNWNSLLSCNSINTPSTLTMGFSLWLALWGCGVASTFKMAVLCSQALHLPPSTFTMAARSSQALHLPRFNFEDGRTGFSRDGRTGFSSAAPVTQTNGIGRISYKQRAQLNPPRCGENTILVLRARRFSTLLNAPR